ncbi:vitamin K epoxide reductase complex subunit 1-like protein 1 [Paramacrobiotus metropolitanus]|uniref:vitamin K epoxide reductase complex subunit 1-like protein 1 n=1 Tax=Paramacrobiotus metropolitanus TaxID=2943436 RepID=UPI00244593C1|nr:vitamin K epoxide reductase complex subunit 1-like protein 1 [Paramacrobiotus metropolitanus]
MASKQKPKIVGDRRWLRHLTVVVSLIGLGISAYGYYVEIRLHQDPSFKPLCDFNKEVRCSKALSSRYGMGFGFLGSVFGESHMLNQPNTLYGIMFYALMACLGYARNAKASLVQLNLAFISCLVSCYLAYHLVFNLKEWCPVCIATYVVNILLLLLSIFKGKPRIAGSSEGGKPARATSAVDGKAKKDDDYKKNLPQTKSDTGKQSYAQAAKSSPSNSKSSGSKSYAQAAKSK